MAGDADGPSADEVITPSSASQPVAFQQKLIVSLPDVVLRNADGSTATLSGPDYDDAKESNRSSNNTLLHSSNDSRLQSATLGRPTSPEDDDDVAEEIIFEKPALLSRCGTNGGSVAADFSPPAEVATSDDYAMLSPCWPESSTPSPLLDFDSRDSEDDGLFPDIVDPVADDEELVDLIIEQATLLSKTILRYLMVMS